MLIKKKVVKSNKKEVWSEKEYCLIIITSKITKEHSKQRNNKRIIQNVENRIRNNKNYSKTW